MAAAVHNLGLVRLIDLAMETGAAVGQLQVGLFKNPITFDATDLIGVYEAQECDFSGYVRKNVDPSAVASESGGQGIVIMLSVVFQHDGGATGNTVEGAFLLDATTDDLVAAADDPTPPVIDTSGETYTATFTFRLGRA